MNYSFKVIDTTTGREVSADKIEQIAKDYGLLEMDIDGFCINEDGHLLLVDDCGKSAYVDVEKYNLTISFEERDKKWFDMILSARTEAVIGVLDALKHDIEYFRQRCKDDGITVDAEMLYKEIRKLMRKYQKNA